MQNSTLAAQQQDSFSLHVLLIGAGPCGLSCAIAVSLAGHRVTVFESVAQLHEVGAGLQITPNGSRLLRRWGLNNRLQHDAAKPDLLRIQRYSGKLLAERTDYEHEVQTHYGSPLWGLHCKDLQAALLERAQELGVAVRLAAQVVDVDLEAPKVILANGEQIAGDLLVAADGLWSCTRSQFLGRDVQPKPTGHMAYRILVHVEQVTDSDLKSWMATPRNNLWIGPDAHAVAYSIRQGTLLNVVVLVPDDLAEDVRREEGDIEQLRRRLHDWDPILTRYLACVSKVDKWRLHHRENLPLLKEDAIFPLTRSTPQVEPLERWRSPSGSFIMAGDACHPILPYMAQGANSALEDAGILGGLLSKVTQLEHISHATRLYEGIRQRRTQKLHQITFQQGKELHLPDGPKQEERDHLLARSFRPVDEAHGRWTHPKWQQWLWKYDAYKLADREIAKDPFSTC